MVGPTDGNEDAQLRELAVLHRHGAREAPLDRSVPAADRHHRRLHGADQRQHLVLHEDPSGPAGRQLHRLRRDRAHQQRPAPERDDRLRMGSPAGPIEDDEFLQVRQPARQRPRVGSREHPHHGVAARVHVHRIQHEVHHRRHHVDPVPLRSEVQGEDRDDGDLDRARERGAARDRRRPRSFDPRRLDQGGRDADAAEAARPVVLRPGLHQGAQERGHLDLDGLVGRCLPGSELPGIRHLEGGDPPRGVHVLDRQPADPGRRPEPRRRDGVHGLRLRPEGAGADRGLQRIRLPGTCIEIDHREPVEGSDGRRQPDGLPRRPDGVAVQALLPVQELPGPGSVEQHVPADLHGVEPPRRHRRLGRSASPSLLGRPAIVWLAVFFVIPLVTMLSLSIQTCDSITLACKLTWHFAEFPNIIGRYNDTFVRSLVYAGTATVAALVVAFPVTYWIAFRAKRKNFFLLMLLVPFFVSFVIRTTAWYTLLADQGTILSTLKNLHLVPESFHVLATPLAVIGGLAYNYLPFTALPLYVALERIDRRVMEASHDLY